MTAHAENHAQDGCVKIYALKEKTPKIYRPEEHTYNHTTGKNFGGIDSRLEKITIPGSAVGPNDTIICRKCKKDEKELIPTSSVKSKGKTVECMRDHEKACKSK